MRTSLKTVLIAPCLLLLLLTCAESQVATEEIAATIPKAQDADWTLPWWTKRHREKIAEAKGAERMDLLMVGDSITHAWEQAGAEVFKECYGHRKVLNLGFSGDCTEHVLWRIQNGAVDGLSPKLAIVMIGTNNTGHRKDPPEHTAAGIELILKELRDRMPTIKILLLAVFPRDRDAEGELRKINAGINRIIKDFADNEFIYFLDINHVFLDKDGSLPKTIMPDALHPNANGYRLWAETMESKVKELMGEE